MRRCIVGRNTICVRPFSVSSRTYTEGESGTQSPVTLSRDQLVNEKLRPTSTSSVHDENTSQIIENAITNSMPRTERPHLPLSPLMNPVYIAAKEKHHLPKAKRSPPEKRTRFQHELSKSPYAQALATPVRKCQITDASLPRFFLQDFEIIAHPETAQPWLMPRSAAASDIDSPERRPTGKHFGSRSYAISRATLLHGFGKKNSPFRRVNEDLFTTRMQKSSQVVNEKNLNMRNKMGVVVLELMRRRLVEALILADTSCVACGGYELAKRKKGVVAVLWVGRPEGQLKPQMSAEDATEGAPLRSLPPEDFSTLDLDREMGSKVPVHNLQRMLGRKHMQKLRERLPQFSETEMVLLENNNASTDLQLKLWRMQSHLYGFADGDLAEVDLIDIATIKQ